MVGSCETGGCLFYQQYITIGQILQSVFEYFPEKSHILYRSACGTDLFGVRARGSEAFLGGKKMRTRSFFRFRAAAFLLAVCCTAWLLFSCRAAPDYFAFSRADFCAAVTGSAAGKPFCAQVTSAGGALSVAYTAPDALAGLLVTSACPDGAGTAVTVSKEGMEQIFTTPVADALLLPARLLASPAELSSLCRKDGFYLLSLSDGSLLTLTPDLLPLSCENERISIHVLSFEEK